MHQRKWGGNASALAKVADAAAAAPLENAPARRRVLEALEGGMEAQATALRGKIEADALAAIAAQPRDAQAHYELAQVYDKQNPARASREYKTVVDLRPDDPRAYYDLAENYWHRGRNRDAVTTFREALKIAAGLGTRALRAGMGARRRKAVCRVGKRVANLSHLSHVNTGRLQRASGVGQTVLFHPPRRCGVSAVEGCCQEEAMMLYAYTLLCGALADTKQYREAIRVGLYAERMQPNDVNAYISVGYAYAMLNQSEPAIEQCRAALRIQPNEPTAHGNLGDELYKIGQKEAARPNGKPP